MMRISEVINLTYEELLIESDNNNLIAKEKELPISKGRIKGNRIAINKSLTETEKKCVLAEELGHYHTTVGDILDQSEVNERKQELQARAWAYSRLVGLDGIIEAYLHGCENLYEIAEYLEVTEEFLNDALLHYKSKFGTHVETDEYIIFFESSIAVLERNPNVLLKIEISAG